MAGAAADATYGEIVRLPFAGRRETRLNSFEDLHMAEQYVRIVAYALELLIPYDR